MVGTVDVMFDLPFGFNSGDDPDPDKRKKDRDPNSPQDPFGFGGAGFDMGDLGQIFSKLGEMFSGAGNVMGSGAQSGPVNYDIAKINPEQLVDRNFLSK